MNIQVQLFGFPNKIVNGPTGSGIGTESGLNLPTCVQDGRVVTASEVMTYTF